MLKLFHDDLFQGLVRPLPHGPASAVLWGSAEDLLEYTKTKEWSGSQHRYE